MPEHTRHKEAIYIEIYVSEGEGVWEWEFCSVFTALNENKFELGSLCDVVTPLRIIALSFPTHCVVSPP